MKLVDKLLITCISVAILGAGGAIAMPGSSDVDPNSTESQPFEQIEQPLGVKIAVTLGGLGLIGLELWWFLGQRDPSD
jgi:plastocyanin domain-containing protein